MAAAKTRRLGIFLDQSFALFVTSQETEATTHGTTTLAPHTKQMSSNIAHVETRAGKKKRECEAHAGEAFPGLPKDVVVTHILRSEYFDDPADLARLKVVSPAMRDAVAATGLKIKELDEWEAVRLGCLSALRRLQRQGNLSRQEYLCQVAARSGHLEVLQWLRPNGCLWCEWTCAMAAKGGHLEVLQCARANGCPWDKGKHSWDLGKCAGAARGGHLEVLQWALANDCPWDEKTCMEAVGGEHLEVLK